MKAAIQLGIGAVLVAGALPSATPAQILKPQIPTGSRIPVKPEVVTGKERSQMLEGLAKCVHRREPARVDYFLRHSDAIAIDPELRSMGRFLPLESCFPLQNALVNEVGARFTVQALRGWLAEQVYRQNNRETQPSAAAAAVPPRPTYAAPAEAGRAAALGAFADCIAAEDSAGADALVRTGWNTPEEKAAARALVPAISACLPQGQTFSLKAEDIRGYAADGLWQRYEATKPTTYEGRP